MPYKIGDKVTNVFDDKQGVITRIEKIAGLMTYFVNEGADDLQAYYENELKGVAAA